MSKRQRSSSWDSSAEIIGSNEDILTEFLLFLPVRSVTRFQSVSKQWRSIISSPSFCRLHTINHRRRFDQPSFLLHQNYGAPPFFLCRPNNINNRLVPFQYNIPGFKHVNILQSCNGLLLLECFNKEKRIFFGSRRKYHYIFNPTTGKYRDLNIRRAYHGLCLAFDPSKSPHYRVFCFKKYNGNKTPFVSVYHSETHTWSKESPGIHEPKHRFTQAIYWKDSFCFLRSQATRRRFSLDDGKIYQLDYHTRARGNKKHYTIESNGHMHSVDVSLMPNGKNRICVYELSDVGSRMTKVYDADHVIDPTGYSGMMSLLGMVRETRIRDSVLLFHVPGKVLLYRLINNTFEVLVDFSKDESFLKEGCLLQFEFQNVHHFIDSFALV